MLCFHLIGNAYSAVDKCCFSNDLIQNQNHANKKGVPPTWAIAWGITWGIAWGIAWGITWGIAC